MYIGLIQAVLDKRLYANGTNGILEFYDDNNSPLGSVNCYFTQADSNGKVNLTSSVYIAIPGGTTLDHIVVFSDNSAYIVGWSYPNVTFTTNGAYTVSNIEITLT